MRRNKVPLIPDLVNCISYSVLPPWYKFKSNVYNIFQHSIFSVNQQVFRSIQINCRYKAEYLFDKSLTYLYHHTTTPKIFCTFFIYRTCHWQLLPYAWLYYLITKLHSHYIKIQILKPQNYVWNVV